MRIDYTNPAAALQALRRAANLLVLSLDAEQLAGTPLPAGVVAARDALSAVLAALHATGGHRFPSIEDSNRTSPP